ncbi:beta-propeller domain-containing protein [Rubinisphaera italica]|uniref:Arylsulfotransferase (ASST) n=1 Tax=Rubinisphaera italica TaxID=2527969 RepID=A0A5C5X9B3_9PLAN|nr:hypothetical protein [Rubinisphaera italica]TWT59530.1 hypothetical protein Pan54_02370 [Rubinisphaera italica]
MKLETFYRSFAVIAVTLTLFLQAGPAVAEEVTHSFLACGQKTYMVDGDGNTIWTYPHSTRDGYVLPNGNIVLTLSKGKQYSGGAVVEVATDGSERLIWKGTQSEVNSAHPTASDTFVITEAGSKPRLLEVDRAGNVVVEFPLECQTENFHLQTRMARKLDDGTYLVPHLLDFAVKNYDRNGKVLSSIDTTVKNDPERKIHSWPFTAIRHGEGHTLVCCTNGNRVVDFNAKGENVWQLTNEDFPGTWLQDPCGGQVLPNGNFVITSYKVNRSKIDSPKLIEVNQDKEVVWTYRSDSPVGIHHFQILDTNGLKLTPPVLK